MKLILNVQNRIAEVDNPKGTKKILMEVSRPKCMDVLLEVVDCNGMAKGKPLQKYLPEIKQVQLTTLWFMMNNNSSKPLTINMNFK